VRERERESARARARVCINERGLSFGSVTPSTQPRDGSEKTKSHSGARRMSKGGSFNNTPLGIGWLEETLGLCTEPRGPAARAVGSRSDTPMSEATTNTNARDTLTGKARWSLLTLIGFPLTLTNRDTLPGDTHSRSLLRL